MNPQTGKKYIVLTGGNAGIGLSALTQLHASGHTIIFGARNQLKNKQVTQSLTKTPQPQQQSHGQISHFQLDLCCPQSIKQFANNVQQKLKQYQNITDETTLPYLDVLVNNAGVCGREGQLKIVDGVEVSVYANHFGHFYLTYLLYPLLKRAKGEGKDASRIINVGSNASQKVKRPTAELAKDEYNADNMFDLDCASKKYDFLEQYSISKLFNNIFTYGLQQYINKSTTNSQIKVVCLHPGFVDTAFGNQNPTVQQIKTKYAQYMIKPAQAKGIAILCDRPFNDLQGGQYYTQKAEIRKMSQVAMDGSNVQKLWGISQGKFGIEFKAII